MFKAIFKKRAEAVSAPSGTGQGVSFDLQFLEDVYHQLLGRGVDETGKTHYLNYLKEGHSRLSVILGIVRSEEFVNKVIRENMPIRSVREELPHRYRLSHDIHGQEAWIFQAERREDFAWLEGKGVGNGVLERPRV